MKNFNSTNSILNTTFKKQLVICSLLFTTLFSALSFAESLKLVDKPLVDSTVSDVLPNLMFILDNSGSMRRNFTPDWVVGNYADPIDNSTPVFTINHNRLPQFSRNSAVNSQYYNPNIRYTPAVNFDGVSRGDQTSWTSVKNDNYNVQSTGSTNLVGNAEYFSFVAGEHCTTKALTNCIASDTPTETHQFAAPIRWCTTQAIANTQLPAMPTTDRCRSIRDDDAITQSTSMPFTFTNIRTPLSRIVITNLTGTNGSGQVSSIKINGIELLSATATSGSNNINNNSNMAARVAAQINACTTTRTGNCTMAGHSATRPDNNTTGSSLTITSPAGMPVSNIVITRNSSTTANTPTVTALRPGSLVFVDILTGGSYPAPGKTVAGPDRTDCPSAACTYTQEMTNYANWFTYYSTRMQGMKTSASQAFRVIDNRYRIGFITINNPNDSYLPINRFEAGSGAQKNVWYNRLFSIFPDGGTPLRSALSTVGRIYAAKAGGPDPVQYACQPNFALLTTDGYWNGAAGATVTGGAIGNLDGAGTPRPQYEGGTVASGTLADVAKYYYDTDLRTSAFGNCTGASSENVCGEGTGNENILRQTMTTLTLGLGIDGTLLYDPEYETQTAGDFADIKKSGALNWPVPVADQPSAIDDLWHAAVNANGIYFSARDPKELSDSLRRALSDIQSKVGTGSAAAASSLQPTKNDNFDYVASYETVKWVGNLEARAVDLVTLETVESATWCVENIAPQACVAPAQLISQDVGGSNAFFCRTTNSDEPKCTSVGGTLSNTNCLVPVANACTGTMRKFVGKDDDTRKIYMKVGGGLDRFSFNNLAGVADSENGTLGYYFSAPFLSQNLSQWPDYSSGVGSQQEKAVGTNLINYLRGQQGFEDRPSNLVTDNRLFRFREATLGDITESQPAYVGEPRFNYVDEGYEKFKSDQKLRSPNVYVGGNDGMLHAFNATNGDERWAFVPTAVIKKMWRLADKSYATNHVNLVNGDPVIGQIFDSTWKTILVGGLGSGGRGYYALDITDPEVPKLLWEKTAQDIANLGYTFGSPIITKYNNKWVVMFTSGYNNGSKDNTGLKNNAPQGNGQGYLYIVNAGNGTEVRTYTTSTGSPETPSGLGPIAAYVDNLSKNNTARFVIGGDLQGNVWKFDLSTTAAPIKLATLSGPNGVQSITTIPQLGIINKNEVAFIGTGKYLEIDDINTKGIQSIYAINVKGSTPLGDPRGSLVPQVLSGTGNNRSITNKPVNFSVNLGWYVDLSAGERVNVESFLVNGVLIAPTIVPGGTSCSPGGFSYLNFFNYLTGSSLVPGGVISEKIDSPIVGFSVTYGADGKPYVKFQDNNNLGGTISKNSDLLTKGGATPRNNILKLNDNGTYGRKYNWRELIQE